MKEIIENLKIQCPNQGDTRNGHYFQKGKIYLYSFHDKLLTLYFDNFEIDAVTEKEAQELLIFFEKPFHLVERLTNRKSDLNSYIYRKLDQLTDEGYILLESGHLHIVFLKDKEKLIYKIDFYTGEIKEFKH